MRTTIQRSALVMHSVEDMFSLVNDVAAYPKYIDGCEGAEVLDEGPGYMIARLDLRRGGVGYSFTTRNTLIPPEEIKLDLHAGPFKHLQGGWVFKALTETACKVSFHLEFEVSSELVGVAANALLSSTANDLVTALSHRADKLFGKAQ